MQVLKWNNSPECKGQEKRQWLDTSIQMWEMYRYMHCIKMIQPHIKLMSKK